MKNFNTYIIEKLKIDKNTKLLNQIKINLDNIDRDSTKDAIHDSIDWFNRIFNDLDNSYIDKMKTLHDKALSKGICSFDEYIKDIIPNISISDYLDNDSYKSAYSKDYKYVITFIKNRISKADKWQEIYDLFWNTLIEYLEDNGWKLNSNKFGVENFRGVDEALNLIFKSIINEKY